MSHLPNATNHDTNDGSNSSSADDRSLARSATEGTLPGGDHNSTAASPWSAARLDELEMRTQNLGRAILEQALRQRPHVYERRWWDERLMQWAMRDERLKVNLFRFVDVLPMLHTSESVVRHLDEYLREAPEAVPAVLKTGLQLSRHTALARSALARAARLAATDLARRFIAGESASEVLRAARRERDRRRGFTLDILGETVASEVEAERFLQAYIELIESVAPETNSWPDQPHVDRCTYGPSPRCNLSIKLSALDSQFDAIDPAGSLRRAGARLRELLRAAKRHGAFINVDMESHAVCELTLFVFQTVLMEPEFRDMTDVGIVVQAYLRRSERDLLLLRDWAIRRGAPVWVRLVKGAYWDYETTHARAVDWPVPVFEAKGETDANFESLARTLIESRDHLRPAIGSHNVRSIAHALAIAEQLGLPRDAVELQMLYGMADSEKQTLVDMGCRMRVYMPYGELIPGMAYLVRRLLENTSNDSFVRMEHAAGASLERLLRRPAAGRSGASADATETRRPMPAPSPPLPAATHRRRSKSRNAKPETLLPGKSQPERIMNRASATSRPFDAEFRNHPPIDFSREDQRQAMRDGLERTLMTLGRRYPLVIGGERVSSTVTHNSLDPSHRARIVGTITLAGKIEADAAVETARRAQPAWRALGAAARAAYLTSAADVMTDRLFDLAALEVYECGKGWREATADIDEAIDFCRFYAERAVALEEPSGADVPGEENRFEYFPIGVAAVIAPWNFPLAILTGMTAAALATGNAVVMKPAEQSSVIAARLMEIFTDIGLPDGVLNYLPGRGETAGAALVEHPHTGLIAFTGSREVGLAIHRRAAEVSASGVAPYVKRVIAEMGGKNAIIVDDDADLDEAVLGVVKSAFGFQGQKCSACSRAIVLDSVYEAFVSRLIEAARSLKVGPAEDPATSVGPVIDEAAFRRIHEYLAIGREEGHEALAVDAGALVEHGWFVGPHIYTDVPPDGRLAQEEIFGPVLAVIRASNLDRAIEIVNSTPFALTAGVFSRSPAHLERARRELVAGNIYLNRPITGALVGRQPFGGFKMSGIGSKSGGDDYLLQFVLPRTITENTLRRGFAPES